MGITRINGLINSRVNASGFLSNSNSKEQIVRELPCSTNLKRLAAKEQPTYNNGRGNWSACCNEPTF